MVKRKRVVTLYPIVNFGAAGAATLQKRTFSAAGTGAATPKYSLVAAPTTGVGYAVGDGEGTRAIVSNGSGNYTITFNDSYLYLIQVSVQFANSGAVFNAPLMVVDTNTANTNVAVNPTFPGGAAGKISVTFYNNSGIATNPSSGDQAAFAIILGDSGAP